MPDLHWREYELLEFFDNVTYIAEYGLLHRFMTIRNGLELRVDLQQYDCQIDVILSRAGSEQSLVRFIAFIRGEIRRIDDPRGQMLEFTDCVIVPDQLTYIDVPVFSRDKIPFSTTIRIETDPDIRIDFAEYRGLT
jgi:hypothetical protein